MSAYRSHAYGQVHEDLCEFVDHRSDRFLQFLPPMAKELVHD